MSLFNKKFTVLALLLLTVVALTTLHGCGGSDTLSLDTEKNYDNDDSGDSSADTTGEGLYTAYCQSCHGEKAVTDIVNKDASYFDTQMDLGTCGDDPSVLQGLTLEELTSIANYLNDITDGRSLYIEYCQGCHAKKGASTFSPATAEEISEAIAKGTGGMNSSTLTSLATEAIEAISEYMSN